MRRGRKGGRKTFTLVELMVLIIMVGILAVIAIPLYTGYVERGRVTEATSIMGAIITSQKVEKSRKGNFYSASTIPEFKGKGIEISDTKYFIYETVTTSNGGFTVTATPTDAFGPTGGWVTYTYDPSADPPGSWAADGTIILGDILLLQT